MKKVLIGFVAVLMMLCVSGCKISGTITESGVGMEGVDVVLSGGVNMATTTDNNGYYEFDFSQIDPLKMDYTVTPTKDGYSFLPHKKDVRFTYDALEIGSVDFIAKKDQRPVLIQFYNSTNGDQWLNNSGWRSPPLADDGFAMPGTENSWYGIEYDDAAKAVLAIRLSNNELTGSLPDTIGTLFDLYDLDVSSNQISGPIPSNISTLQNLQSLTLADNELSGIIPTGLITMPALQHIDIERNRLCAMDSESIEFLDAHSPGWRNQKLDTECAPVSSVLMELYTSTGGPNWTNSDNWGTDADVSTWYGVVAHQDGKFDLILENNNLDGSLPASLSELTNLVLLDLSGNHLTGSLPESIGELTQLLILDLSDNELSGSIPSSIVSLTNTELRLGQNQLYAEEPEVAEFLNVHAPGWVDQTLNMESVRLVLMELYESTGGPNWTNSDNWDTDADVSSWYGVFVYPSGYPDGTFELHLHNNNLNGPLPASLSELTNLVFLDLSANHLTGPLPESIGELTQLRVLDLTDNELSGAVPSTIMNLTNTELRLGQNQLYVQEPEVAEFLNVHAPGWVDQRLGTEPVRRVLMELYAYTGGTNWNNNGNWGTDADVSSWYGVFAYPSGYPDGKFELHLHNNNLNGPIPASLSELTKLVFLDLSGNHLTGSIPERIGELTQLGLLDLTGNELGGPIPSTIMNLTNTELYLGGNHLYVQDPAVVEFLDMYSIAWMDQTLNPEPVRRVLMELYESTDGPNWTNSDHWGTDADVSSWYGVLVYPNGYPDGKFELHLHNNNLSGPLPDSISELSNIVLLDLSNNDLTGSLTENIGEMVGLNELYLMGNQLSGPIPESIGLLTQLRIIDLSDNQLSGPIPLSIMNLTNTELFLFQNHLSVQDPVLVDFLNAHAPGWQDQTLNPEPIRRVLMELYESTDGPNWTNNYNWDTDADVSSWYGVFAYPSGYPDGKFELYLYNNNLNGPLPASIAELTNLVWLDLYGNHLTGALPEDIGELTQLRMLELTGNEVSGPIPLSIMNLTNTDLYLGGNHLYAQDPVLVDFLNVHAPSWVDQSLNPEPVRRVLMELYESTDGPNWTNSDHWGTDADVNFWYGVLAYPSGYPDGKFELFLGVNNLNGSLPTSIAELQSLVWLDLYGNHLSGVLPDSIGELTQLQLLEVSGNELSGPIPSSIVELTNTDLFLGGNHLYVQDPVIVDFLNVHAPSWVDQSLNPEPVRRVLMELYESTDGPNWTNSGNWGTDMDVSSWYGVFVYPSGYPDGKFELHLYNNNLSGPLPASISELANLQLLFLSNNHLTGSLPENIGDMASLNELHLSGNQLTGQIPESIGELTQLRILELTDNQLSGPIPSSIMNLTNTDIYLGRNHLSTQDFEVVEFLDMHALGWWDQTIGTEAVRRVLTELYESTGGANWTNNDNWGTDTDVACWYGVFVYPSGYPDGKFELHLAYNNLNGSLPASIAELTNLQVLNLNDNQLTGALPENVGDMVSLNELNLTLNQLSGPIPESIGALTQLRIIDLTGNEMSGLIPASIINLSDTDIYIGYNHLCAQDLDLISFLDMHAPGWREGQTNTVCE